MELNTLSISGLVKLFNAAVENHELFAKPVSKFGSKAAGIARIEKLMADHALTLEVVNDELALVLTESKDPVADEAEGDAQADEPTAKPAGKRRGPTPEFTDEMIVHLLVENPKRIGSKARARFAGYRDGMTVAQAIAAGLNRDDFRWDTDHGFIDITPPEGDEDEDEAEAHAQDESPADESPAPEAEDTHDQAA